jgi:hypothetical protein
VAALPMAGITRVLRPTPLLWILIQCSGLPQNPGFQLQAARRATDACIRRGRDFSTPNHAPMTEVARSARRTGNCARFTGKAGPHASDRTNADEVAAPAKRMSMGYRAARSFSSPDISRHQPQAAPLDSQRPVGVNVASHSQFEPPGNFATERDCIGSTNRAVYLAGGDLRVIRALSLVRAIAPTDAE